MPFITARTQWNQPKEFFIYVCETWYFDAAILIPLLVHGTIITLLQERGDKFKPGRTRNEKYTVLHLLNMQNAVCRIVSSVDNIVNLAYFLSKVVA